MACKFEYIDKASVSDEAKQKAEEKHIELVRALLSSKLASFWKNHLSVFVDSKSSFEDFVKYTLNAENMIRLKPVHKDGDVNKKVVGYRVLINTLNDNGDFEEYEELDRGFYASLFNTNALLSMTKEFQEEMENYEDKFSPILENIVQRNTAFIKQNEQLSDAYEIGPRIKDLKRINAQLSSEELSRKLTGFSSYIIDSVNKIDWIDRRFFGDEKTLSIKERLENAKNLVGEDKKIEMQSIANLLNQGRIFYHLFDELGTIKNELKKLPQYKQKGARKIDSFEVEKLDKNLKELFDKYELPKEKQEEILNGLAVKNAQGIWEGFLETDSELLLAIKERLNEGVKTDGLYMDMKEALNKSMKKYPPVFDQLINAIGKKEAIQAEFNDLYLDVAVAILYPEYEKSFTDDKFKRSEKEFRHLLQNADNDSGFLAGWLGAAADSSDQLLAFITTYLKRNINEQHLTKVENTQNVLDVYYEGGFDKKSEEEMKKVYDKMYYKTKTLKLDSFDELIPLTQADVDSINNNPEDERVYIIMNHFGTPSYYEANNDEMIHSEFDKAKYQAESRTFYHELNAQSEWAFETLRKDLNQFRNEDGSIVSGDDFYNVVKNILPQVKNLDRLFTSYTQGNVKILKPEIEEAISTFKYSRIKDMIHTVYQMDFYDKRFELKTEQEVESLKAKLGLNDIDFSQEQGQYTNLKARKNFKANVRTVDLKTYGENSNNLKLVLQNNFDLVYGKVVGQKQAGNRNSIVKEILVIDNEGKYKTILVEKVEVTTKAGVNVFINMEDVEISKFHTYKGEFQTLKNQFRLPTPNFTKEEARLFTNLKSLVQEGAKKFGSGASLTPYITYQDDKSLVEKIRNNPRGALKGAWDEFSDLSPEKDSYPLIKNGEYVDHKGNPVKHPIYVSYKSHDLAGKSLHVIKPKFNNFVSIENRNRNLLEVALMYNNAASTYSKQQEMLPQINLIKALVEGDEQAGITVDKDSGIVGRRTQKRGVLNQILTGKAGKKLLVKAEKLNTQLENTINSLFFKEELEDQVLDLGITKISMNKLSQKFTGFGNLQVMMMNLTTMLPNFSIAAIQMRSASVMGEFFTTSDFNSTFRNVFGKHLPKFFSDIVKTKTKDKSVHAQLAIRYNAIQGEVMDAHGVVHKENLANKFFSNALFFNQNSVEFLNQVLTMEMVMRGFKLKDINGNDTNLWESIDPTWQQGEDIRYKFEIESLSNFKQIELDFMARLQAINRSLHGAYASEDKNELQRFWAGRLMMMYKKYLYPSYKARLGEEKFSFELKSTEEGYVRTYLKEIFKEYRGLGEEKGYIQGIQEKGIGTLAKSAGAGLLKLNLAAWDAATFRLGSKYFSSVDEYLYGKNIEERKKRAIMRATWEMGFLLQVTILGYLLQWAIDDFTDEDDELARMVLQTLEVNAFRMQNDLGMYLPFVYSGGLPGGHTIDQFTRISKDPFTSVRTIDQTAGFFHQLIGVDWTEDGIDFAFNDTYDKKGFGYEKGDSKLLHKGYKVFLSPYWQVIKFMSPEEQLQYMNLMYKSSK